MILDMAELFFHRACGAYGRTSKKTMSTKVPTVTSRS